MMHPLLGHTPKIGEGSLVVPSAQLIGDVTLGKRCSVWYNTTLRGDVMPIVVGDETNIQDNSVLHGTFKKAQARLGSRTTIGHSVILHGCQVGDLCLIGMGSILMDHVQIPDKCIVGAGSLVTEGSKFESGYLILGRPAKAVRLLNPDEIKFLDQSADNYLHYMTWYQERK